MHLTILGGGLSALSAAYFLQERPEISRITILEKETVAGGLCRSYSINGIVYDIGPHIFFSKNTLVLQLMNDLLGANVTKLRRSNRILHKGRFVQYPFENDLSKLPPDDRNYCLNAFLANPYEHYNADTMLQFFLKTFGDGITNLYLRPYNEKIWKFDPSFMDTQMVERIPKPPREDILRSAAGETVDGYLHQLYFTYPRSGGTESLIRALRGKLSDKVCIRTNCAVTGIRKSNDAFEISSSGDTVSANRLVSTIPANLFASLYAGVPDAIVNMAKNLKYNSIVIGIVNVNCDRAGDNFAFMIPDRDVIFHRLSKIDFLGESYHLPDTTTYMVEVTYRSRDLVDAMSDEDIKRHIAHGLERTGFIENGNEINFMDINRFEYAYVIYDLEHRRNMDSVLGYFEGQGVSLLGRFGSFEYLNMDAVIEQAMKFAEHCAIPGRQA
jgi:protoporphyrinogen oxidase